MRTSSDFTYYFWAKTMLCFKTNNSSSIITINNLYNTLWGLSPTTGLTVKLLRIKSVNIIKLSLHDLPLLLATEVHLSTWSSSLGDL